METTMSQTHKRNVLVMDGIAMNTCLQRMIKVVSLLHYSPPQKSVRPSCHNYAHKGTTKKKDRQF